MCTMMNSADDDEQRFLVSGTPFSSYDELTTTLRNVLFTKLPPQEIIQTIALYFTVTKLDSSETRAIACSSSTKQHKLQQCLIDSISSWWISSMGSFRKGKGEEWVEFELDKSKIVRLSSISINIPMLPYGPLSVRTMRIDTKADSNNNNNNGDINKHRGTWRPSSSLLTVANRTGWQRIDLEEPIDAQVIKLVCLTNQASISLSNEDGDDEASAVGFFTVKFE